MGVCVSVILPKFDVWSSSIKLHTIKIPKLPVTLTPVTATFAFASGVIAPTDPSAASKEIDKLLLDTVVAVPIALVPTVPDPVSVTMASPSTATERLPTVPTAPSIEAIACAFTPATGAPVVPTKETGVTLASASTAIVPKADVPAPGAVSVTGKGSPKVNPKCLYPNR